MQQCIINRCLGCLIDDYQRVLEYACVQLMAQPSCLARPEVAAEHRQSHAAISACIYISREHGSANKARCEGINGFATHAFHLMPNFGEIANNGMLARLRRKLYAGHQTTIVGFYPIGRKHPLQNLRTPETRPQPVADARSTCFRPMTRYRWISTC
jgi:hypothetical protein